MKLTLMERLIVMEYLPKEEDWAGMKEVRKAKEILSFTPEEIEKFEINQEGSFMRWNNEGQAFIKDLPITEWATTKVQEALRKKNNEKKLVERDVSVYQKFIVDYDQI